MTTVFVVEDDLTLLENIELDLEMRGYNVICATNGQEAINILHASTTTPDIIVSDIAMPDVDGFKLLEYLRSTSEWNAIPFLFLTAFDSPNSIRISKELGVDDYITKPFLAEDLVIAMENKLKRISDFKKHAEHQMDESRKMLLHMMSHELRSPLLSVYGGTEMLADSLAHINDDTIQQILHIVQSGIQKLNLLSNKTLAYLQIESGLLASTFQKSRRTHSMNEIVMNAIGSIKHKMGSHLTIPINFHDYPEPLYVSGILEFMVMIIEEPIYNAITFSRNHGKIDVTLTCEDHTATVTITDTGIGIPQSELDNIWKPFVQVDRDTLAQSGTGLGLAIVAEAIAIHQGTCTAKSEIGKGTTITIQLPLVDLEENV